MDVKECTKEKQQGKSKGIYIYCIYMLQQETDHKKNSYPGSEQKVPVKEPVSLLKTVKFFVIWTFWQKEAKTLTYFTLLLLLFMKNRKHTKDPALTVLLTTVTERSGSTKQA